MSSAMHLEILVEEPSAEAALINLVPKIMPGVEFDIHVHNGKLDLLEKLPGRMQGYRHWLPDDWRIVVLMDEDREDCVQQKNQLEEAARKADLTTRAVAERGQQHQVVNRLAVEEWFFGDVEALVAAYPGVSDSLGRQARYRNPDRITGGTWEALERVLRRAGYYSGGIPKIEVATMVSEHMLPGLLSTKRGVSVYDRPDNLERFGGAYRVTNLPSELAIIKRGVDPDHYEIAPAFPMTQADYEAALAKIFLIPVTN